MAVFFYHSKVLRHGVKLIDINAEQFYSKEINDYFLAGEKVLGKISRTAVASLVIAIDKVRKSGKTLYIAGNGGSASTASHFVTDFGTGSLIRKNPVKAVSLCDNTAIITAVANDVDFSQIFAQQLKLLANRGDLFICISASGNSSNILKALDMASQIGIEVFSLTGFDGGELRERTPKCNVHVETPKGAYGLVEDAHLAICHIVTECIRLNLND